MRSSGMHHSRHSGREIRWFNGAAHAKAEENFKTFEICSQPDHGYNNQPPKSIILEGVFAPPTNRPKGRSKSP